MRKRWPADRKPPTTLFANEPLRLSSVISGYTMDRLRGQTDSGEYRRDSLNQRERYPIALSSLPIDHPNEIFGIFPNLPGFNKFTHSFALSS